MSSWEQRAKKLEAKRRRQKKYGRSLLTAVRAAEEKRLRELKKRAEEREKRD
ncbi:MAG: hypothetical protein LC118_13955 [Dehalococcoidia bacterium]|nr:hypothetical protein [Dehalococcoidia bacterium]